MVILPRTFAVPGGMLDVVNDHVRLRPQIEALPAYVPGARPSGSAFKLSSNENPFPPPPSIVAAIIDAAQETNRYPDMYATELTEAIAAHIGVDADQVVVGFAAETADSDEDLLDRGRRKRARKGVDLLVVNRVSWDAGFETPDNRVLILDDSGAVVADAEGTKREVADAVWDAVAVSR